jgi:LPP20 lipoprotein
MKIVYPFYRNFTAVLSIMTAFFLLACGDKEVTQTQATPVPAKPQWVDQRPMSGMYYIGIGSCSKYSQPLDYQTIAKKNALNDLASEISVKVQGSTFLNALEVNKNFSEEFISSITTTTNENIENFEVAGSWEDKGQFWIYYRLNKMDYAQQKAEKKSKSMSVAYDFYSRGLEAEKLNNPSAAIDAYMRGLFAIKEYWNELNEYPAEKGNVLLDNELYASLQRTIGGLSIKGAADKIVLSAQNNFSQDFKCTVLFNNAPSKGVKCSAGFPTTTAFSKAKEYISDDNGQFYVPVSKVNPSEKNKALSVQLQIEQLLPADLDHSVQMGLVKNIRTDSRQVPIDLVTPTFYIESGEQSFDNPTNAHLLGDAMQSALVQHGMRISTNITETDYILSLASNTRRGETNAQGFYVAFLDLSISVVRKNSGEVAYRENPSQIKGVQLNFSAANTEAYRKAKEKIEQEMVKSIVNAIM